VNPGRDLRDGTGRSAVQFARARWALYSAPLQAILDGRKAMLMETVGRVGPYIAAQTVKSGACESLEHSCSESLLPIVWGECGGWKPLGGGRSAGSGLVPGDQPEESTGGQRGARRRPGGAESGVLETGRPRVLRYPGPPGFASWRGLRMKSSSGGPRDSPISSGRVMNDQTRSDRPRGRGAR
jgi:hypothetical protein